MKFLEPWTKAELEKLSLFARIKDLGLNFIYPETPRMQILDEFLECKFFDALQVFNAIYM